MRSANALASTYWCYQQLRLLAAGQPTQPAMKALDALKAKDEFAFTVLFEGKPLAGVKLTAHHRNGDAIKVYDARTGGGFPSPAPVPGCAAADECHGPSSEAPASASNGTGAGLMGTGNVRKVKKPGKKKSANGKKSKKTKKKHHKRAHAKRGANHG